MGSRSEREPFLAIDVGNTSVSYGFFKNGRLFKKWRCYFSIIPEIDRYIIESGSNTNSYKVVISSVNPKKLVKIEKYYARRSNRNNLLIIGSDIKPRIAHKYLNLNRLGKDRLVNIYGAIRWYKKPLLIINFGTAITVDYISKGGVFEGGLIIPGVETAWNALQEKAALLPKIPLKDYRTLIGRNTEACMKAGSLQGFGAMVDGLIERFKKRYGRSFTVLASGGLAKKVRPYVHYKLKVDQDHTLKSIALVYRSYLNSKI